MERTAIIYTTKHGTTKRYADWLKEELPAAEVLEMEAVKPEDLDRFDSIALGGPVYGGSLATAPFLEKNLSRLLKKKTVLFAVGCLDPDTEPSRKSYQSLPEPARRSMAYHKLPGDVGKEKMSLAERLAMKLIKAKPFGDPNKQAVLPVVRSLTESQPLAK